MLYYLFTYLDKLDIPGAGVFQYISFRSAMAIITSLIISMAFGKSIIRLLQKQQIGEVIRDLGLEGQMQKRGTPTMGGLMILASIVIPVVLFCKVNNVYILLMLFTTLFLGAVGFVDDYLKTLKRSKDGLRGKFKIIGQIIVGLVVGLTLFLNDDVVIREKIEVGEKVEVNSNTEISSNENTYKRFQIDETRSTKVTIPFFKNNEFDYASLLWFMGDNAKKWVWLVLIPIYIIIIVAVSNGTNLTDGLDGLATGVSAIVGATLGILAYVSGNTVFADYLSIMYIPNTGELVIFISAFIGATVGFLWYNSFPAQVFMGDTGSLALGGIIAVFAIIIRKELMIPVLCGIFLVENLSVVLQVSYFKYTKKKYGEGRRIFRMSPLHHHYQVKGMPESKIVIRFWIVAILLAVISIVTLKIR